MRPVICKNISPKHVNIAMFKGERVVSDEIIQIRDLSIQIQENQLPVFEEARQTTLDNTSTLNITSDTLTPSITSEYNFISENAEFIPLFLKHELQLSLYNDTVSDRNIIIKNMIHDVSYQLATLKEELIIIPNTVIAYDKTNAFSIIQDNRYIVDYGKKQIIFNGSSAENHSVVITFKTITNNIDISDEFNNKIESKFFRIHVNKYETSPNNISDRFVPSTTLYLNNLYTGSIYFANILEKDITYFITYPYFDISKNKTVIRKEAINPTNLYSKVDSFLGSHTYKSNVFTVDEDNYSITTKLHSFYPIVFVKSPTNRNSKIALLEPQQVPHEKPWFIEVSNDRFKIDTLTYRPLERLSQNIINSDYTIFQNTEDITLLDSTTIKTNLPNLVIRIDAAGNVSNITIQNSDQNINSLIEWVDARRGLIKLKREITIDQLNSAITYEYKINNIVINNPNINPYLLFHKTNDNLLDKFIVYYMLPEEELNITYSKSIFYIEVFQHPEWYENVPEHKESITNAIEYILGNSAGISNLYNEISQFINVNEGPLLHPIILGYVGVGNITTPDSIYFEDIRRRGGGLKVKEYINEILSTYERHYLDIAKIDGYDYNLSNAMVIKISPLIKEGLKQMFTKYDTNVQREVRDNPLFNLDNYILDFIEQIIRKYVNAAAHFTIEFKD